MLSDLARFMRLQTSTFASIPASAHTTTLTVRSYETTTAGKVAPATLLRYLEQIATLDSAARGFLQEFGIRYTTGPDNGTNVSRAYRITGVPETYVVDKQGNIAAALPLPTSAKELRGILDKALAQ